MIFCLPYVHHQAQLCELLINYGAELTAVDAFGQTALALARQHGSTVAAKVLEAKVAQSESTGGGPQDHGLVPGPPPWPTSIAQ